MEQPSSEYQPVDCGLHDRYEAASVRREIVRVEWRDGAGRTGTAKGRITDILVRSGAEYLVVSDGSTVRLDHIAAFAPISPQRARDESTKIRDESVEDDV
jgi:Rho-binding antiterminator